MPGLMSKRKSWLIVAAVLSLAGVAVFAWWRMNSPRPGGVIEGTVREVVGEQVIIEAQPGAQAGDPVILYFLIPGFDDLGTVGSGSVIEVQGARVTANIQQRSGDLAVGQIAKIGNGSAGLGAIPQASSRTIPEPRTETDTEMAIPQLPSLPEGDAGATPGPGGDLNASQLPSAPQDAGIALDPGLGSGLGEPSESIIGTPPQASYDRATAMSGGDSAITPRAKPKAKAQTANPKSPRDVPPAAVHDPPVSQALAPGTLENQLIQALHDARMSSVTAKVSANFEVTLRGSVPSAAEKQRAFLIALSFPEVQGVKDQVFVVEE